ncbi:MAG: DUF4838 domain-containing protein [Armatimonadota bacterium]
MKIGMLVLLACISLLLIAMPSFAITLVDKGIGESVIVVAIGSPETVQFAAEELQTYISKISGAKLPIVEIAKSDSEGTRLLAGKKLILVGESTVSRKMGFSAKNLKPDGFQIASTPDAVIIIGKDNPNAAVKYATGNIGSAGTLYGVYRFLSELGVRWFFPGRSGEVVPGMDKIDIRNMQITDAPWAVYRMAIASSEEEQLWCRRVGFGGAMYPGFTLHAFTRWYDNLSLDHPEFFALRASGNRGTNLCWYAPGVRDMMIKHAKSFFTKAPADVYPDYMLLENDGAPAHCVCPLCSTRLKPEEGFYGDMSDYAVEAAVEVANAVKADYPDRMVAIGAYNNTTRPPVKIRKLPPNVSVQIAKHTLDMNWTNAGKENMYDDVIGGWLKLKPAAIAFFDYYNFDCWGGAVKWRGVPAVATEIIGQDIKRVKQMCEENKTLFLGERIYSGAENRSLRSPNRYWWICPDLYIAAKLLWNPDASVKTIREDFFKEYFGPAAEPMKKFYTLAEDTWTIGGASLGTNYFCSRGLSRADIAGKTDNWLAQNPWDKLFTPSVLEEMSVYLAEAEQLCGNSPYKEHLKIVKDGFQFTLEQSAKCRGIKPASEDLTEAIIRS